MQSLFNLSQRNDFKCAIQKTNSRCLQAWLNLGLEYRCLSHESMHNTSLRAFLQNLLMDYESSKSPGRKGFFKELRAKCIMFAKRSTSECIFSSNTFTSDGMSRILVRRAMCFVHYFSSQQVTRPEAWEGSQVWDEKGSLISGPCLPSWPKLLRNKSLQNVSFVL